MATKTGHFAKCISHKIHAQILDLLYAKTLVCGLLPEKYYARQGRLFSVNGLSGYAYQ
jgi:hypothetical protein